MAEQQPPLELPFAAGPPTVARVHITRLLLDRHRASVADSSRDFLTARLEGTAMYLNKDGGMVSPPESITISAQQPIGTSFTEQEGFEVRITPTQHRLSHIEVANFAEELYRGAMRSMFGTEVPAQNFKMSSSQFNSSISRVISLSSEDHAW